MALREPTRRRFRVASAGLFAAGIMLLGIGVWVQHGSSDVAPVPLVAGGTVELPQTDALGGRVAVYGTPQDAVWPTADDLGCSLNGSAGATRLVGRTDGDVTGPADLDRRVIGSNAVVPLLEVLPADGGGALSCSRLGQVAPAYLIVATGVRGVTPMAAFSLASLTLVLGAGGLVTLRPEVS